MIRLEAKNLVKRFRIFKHPRDRILYSVSGWGRTAPYIVKALNDLNFSVDSGTVLGIIGENGAGKSTLLKIMAGIFAPDEGSFTSGTLKPILLQLGAGFHPDLSGEENARIGSILHGNNGTETRKNLSIIAEFSELGDFFYRPVKTYSQGMIFRLGFSIAAGLKPDLFLIDETMAVGDEYFKTKCFGLLDEFRKEGVTLVVASHDLDLLRHYTTRILFMEGGKIEFDGDPSVAVDSYLGRAYGMSGAARKSDKGETVEKNESRASRGIEFDSVKLLGPAGESSLYKQGDSMIIKIGYRVSERIGKPVFGIGVFRSDGVYISGINHIWHETPLMLPCFENGDTGTISCRIKSIPMTAGSYHVSVWCHDHNGAVPIPVKELSRAAGFRIGGLQARFDGAILLENEWKWKAVN